MSKSIVHYIDVSMPVMEGASAHVKPADHPEADKNNRWIVTGTVLKVMRTSHGPSFETKDHEYRPVAPQGYALHGRDFEGFTKPLADAWQKIKELPRKIIDTRTPVFA